VNNLPDRAIFGAPGLTIDRAWTIATRAMYVARAHMPRVTSVSAFSLTPIAGEGWFGLSWTHPHIWYQEMGIRPFTMRSLAGKTIPMWVNDPHGELARKQKRPRTRVTADGRSQTLIFRRAAKFGQRKQVWQQVQGQMVRRTVPMSYPGAPGRIAVNRSQGLMRQGDVNPGQGNPGWIAKGNVGVRWRHPGLQPGRHVARGIIEAAIVHGLPVVDVQYLTASQAHASNYTVLVAKG